MNKQLKQTTTLNNGVEMPRLGLGVFQVPDEQTAEMVYTAIKNGYYSIDTAAIYGNEAGVGAGIQRALQEGIVTREELFITSKVWNNSLSFDDTLVAFEKSLQKLQLDYLDLYLIHWPGHSQFEQPWKAMEALYTGGKIKAIGVCNFEIEHLEQLNTFAKITPAINQVELHPKLQQRALSAYAQEHGIQLEAWGPLMQGGLFDNETLQAIANRYDKSISQIILRWDYQQG
ncbi:MAG TPA: aldo/keto reductase, partial [Rummeliibacillus sp.]|nr:aldo/keto reductase [Rummeliibacillus sp.]